MYPGGMLSFHCSNRNENVDSVQKINNFSKRDIDTVQKDLAYTKYYKGETMSNRKDKQRIF